jgi:hypothetical protein
MDSSLVTSDANAAVAAAASTVRQHRAPSALNDTPASRMRALQRAMQGAQLAIALERSGDTAAAAARFASSADELKMLAGLASLGDGFVCSACRLCRFHSRVCCRRGAALGPSQVHPPSSLTCPFAQLPTGSSSRISSALCSNPPAAPSLPAPARSLQQTGNTTAPPHPPPPLHLATA